eukprot:scaffold10028_cov236-Isochrysis_galbana.AAC.2
MAGVVGPQRGCARVHVRHSCMCSCGPAVGRGCVRGCGVPLTTPQHARVVHALRAPNIAAVCGAGAWRVRALLLRAPIY